MALKRPKGDPGRTVVLEHVSEILKHNPLGDPHVRKLGVWLPPGYDPSGSQRFPVLYDLVGFTGSGLSHLGWKPFGDNVPERAARLMREGKMGPAIFVFPDCFTSLGGNQYMNSPAIGNYADYLTRELIPLVDREFRTLASREHRGCFSDVSAWLYDRGCAGGTVGDRRSGGPSGASAVRVGPGLGVGGFGTPAVMSLHATFSVRPFVWFCPIAV